MSNNRDWKLKTGRHLIFLRRKTIIFKNKRTNDYVNSLKRNELPTNIKERRLYM